MLFLERLENDTLKCTHALAQWPEAICALIIATNEMCVCVCVAKSRGFLANGKMD